MHTHAGVHVHISNHITPRKDTLYQSIEGREVFRTAQSHTLQAVWWVTPAPLARMAVMALVQGLCDKQCVIRSCFPLCCLIPQTFVSSFVGWELLSLNGFRFKKMNEECMEHFRYSKSRFYYLSAGKQTNKNQPN